MCICIYRPISDQKAVAPLQGDARGNAVAAPAGEPKYGHIVYFSQSFTIALEVLCSY